MAGAACCDEDVSSSKPLLEINNITQPHTAIVARPIRAWTLSWAPTSRDVVINQPIDMGILLPMFETLVQAGYTGVRFDIEVQLESMVETTVAGMVRVGWIPAQDSGSGMPAGALDSVGNLNRIMMPGISSQIPGVNLNLSTDTCAHFTIPWVLPMDWMPVPFVDYNPVFARLVIASITMPQIPSGVANPKFRLWLRPINIICFGSVATRQLPTW